MLLFENLTADIKTEIYPVIVKKQGTSDVTKNPVIIRLMKNMKMDENEFYDYLEKPDITKFKGVKVLPSSEINNHIGGLVLTKCHTLKVTL
jgi:hypothetical protein